MRVIISWYRDHKAKTTLAVCESPYQSTSHGNIFVAEPLESNIDNQAGTYFDRYDLRLEYKSEVLFAYSSHVCSILSDHSRVSW